MQVQGQSGSFQMSTTIRGGSQLAGTVAIALSVSAPVHAPTMSPQARVRTIIIVMARALMHSRNIQYKNIILIYRYTVLPVY